MTTLTRSRHRVQRRLRCMHRGHEFHAVWGREYEICVRCHKRRPLGQNGAEWGVLAEHEGQPDT
jgi:hypothetical protein